MAEKVTTETKKKRKAGEGSVYQLANGKWVGKLHIGFKANGKPHRKTFSGKTEAEVNKKIKDFNKEKEKFSSENAIKLSLNEFIKEWLYTTKFYELKESSFDRLESTINTHILPELGFIQIHNIEIEDIQNLINKLFKDGLSHSSIKKVYDALNGCFRYATIKGLKNSPMLGVSMISANRIPKKQTKYFTREEKELFEEEALRRYKTGRQVYRNGYVFILMLNTGIREGEALAINKHKDIDFENNLLRIRRNISTVLIRDRNDPSNVLGRDTVIQGSTKTQSGDRLIPLNKMARLAIDELLKISHEDSELLVSNSNGNPISTLNKTFAKILFASGIEKEDNEECGTHTLRHYFASELFRKGVDIKEISELLGHANIGITYNTYIHLIKEQKVKAIQSLDILNEE